MAYELWGVEIPDRFRLAIGEALSNAARHGRGDIHLIGVIDGDDLIVTVMDHGRGFTPSLADLVGIMPGFDEPGGRGVPLISIGSDRVRFYRSREHFVCELALRIPGE